jgi:hypothetical protein
MNQAERDSHEEVLERFYARRQRFFTEIDSLRAQASALWDKFRDDGNLSISEVAVLEGLRHKRQEVFDAYQEDEARFIDLVLRRRSS